MPQAKKKTSADQALDKILKGQGQQPPTPSPTPADRELDNILSGQSVAPADAALDEILKGQSPSAISELDKIIGEQAGRVGSGIADIYRATPGSKYLTSAISSLSPAFEFLQRPSYAVNKFFDALPEDANKQFGLFDRNAASTVLETVKALPGAIGAGLKELWSPQSKLSYSDVIKKADPEFAKKYPTATETIGFLHDVAYDPTSYLGASTTGRGIKVGGRVLTEEGEQALVRQMGRASTAKVTLGRTVTQAGKDIIQELKALGVEVKGKVPEIRKLAKTEASDAALGKFANEGIRETAENQIIRLIDIAPTLEDTLFKPKGIRATFLGGEIPGTTSYLKVKDKLGLGYAAEKMKMLNKLPGIRAVNEVFNRNAGLKTEYIDARNTIQGQLSYIEDQTSKNIKDTFALTQSQRDDLKTVLSEFKTKMRDEEKKLGRGLNGAEANTLVGEFMSAKNIDPEQMAVLSNSMNAYKQLQQLEHQANLLERTATSTEPGMYDAIKSLDDFILIDNNKFSNPSLIQSAFQKGHTLYDNFLSAIGKGVEPKLDAVQLYAQRMLNARVKMVRNDFNESIKTMYGVEKLTELPRRVKEDIRLIEGFKYVGDSINPSGMNEAGSAILKMYDRLQGLWKFGTTVVKPSFAVKQLPSNTFQSALLTGVRALKMFDPRAAIDAGILLFGSVAKVTLGERKLPEFIQNFINKSLSGSDAVLAERAALEKITGEERLLDYAKDFTKRSNLGPVYSGTQIVEEAKKYGVIRGMDMTESRKSFGERVEVAIRQLPSDNHNLKVTKELMKWWSHTSLVEDYGRMTQFINSLGMGYSPKQAAKLVNETLFDYQNGLSKVEREVIRRIIPFYSFNRFAVPLLLKGTMENPGAIATTQKLVNVMEKYLSSGQELTPDDREIFIGGNGTKGSYLLDQARVYAGFDEENKMTFNVFNNMTPLDVFKGIQYKSDGSVDLQRTAELNVLTILSPFIKMPMELAANRNFFTDRVIDPKKVKVSSVSELFGAKVTSEANLGKNAGVYKIVSNNLPDYAKDAIGWEVYRNPKTGKETVFVNPYFAYTMTNVLPSMRQFIRLGDSNTAWEFALDAIGGIAKKEVDLKQKQAFDIRGLKEEEKQLRIQLDAIRRRANPSDFEEKQEQYQKLIEFNRQRQSDVEQLQPRGPEQP